MAQIAGVTHDISIQVGANERGFMLRRGKDNTKLWTIKSISIVPRAFTTGAPSYANVPGDIFLPIEQSQFHGGIGEEVFESGYKINYADHVDVSTQGNIYSSPARRIEVRPAIQNSNFEEGTVGGPPPGWTVISGTPTIETSCADYYLSPYNGSKLCRLDPGEGIKQSFSIAGINAGDMFSFQAAIGLASGKQLTVTIDGGSASRAITVTNNGESPQWIVRTFSWVIPSNFTELTIKFEYGAGAGSSAGVDYLRYAEPRHLCHHGTDVYLARENFIEKWSETNGWDWQDTMPVSVSDLASYGSYLVVGQGRNNPYYYGNENVFTAHGGSYPHNIAEQLGVVGNILWKSILSNVYWTTTVSGTWTSIGAVGSGPTVVHIPEHPSVTFVCKSEGLYAVDTTPSVTIYDNSLTSDQADDFGFNAYAWHGYLYLPCGINKLNEVSDAAYGSVIKDISPSGMSPDVPDYIIKTRALTGDDRYLYMIGLQQATSPQVVWLFKGANRNVGGDTDWRWYPLRKDTISSSSNVYDCIVYPGSKRKLFVATGDGMWYYFLPAFHGDIFSDSEYRFASGGNGLRTVWYDGNYGLWDKSWHRLTVHTRNCSTSNTISIYYQLTDNGSWLYLGAITSSPITSFSFADAVSKKIRLKFVLSSSLETSSPVLMGYLLEAKLREPLRREFAVSINLSNKVILLNGSQIQQDVKSARDFLYSAYVSKAPVILRDEFNSAYLVDIDSYSEYYEVDMAGEDPMRTITLVMREI